MPIERGAASATAPESDAAEATPLGGAEAVRDAPIRLLQVELHVAHPGATRADVDLLKDAVEVARARFKGAGLSACNGGAR